ncbi:thiamine transport system ATP-binding protein [Tamaricihabitans halophyticus]|uniref:ABC-type quaternary amine transporter n=1 Tax=Tamaricihabitans halophyticus TaxID=1262583 RepID=A0A4R2R3H4_9PSEU|nr:ABC transporter ATP-binding protein [Tamaricihabitans halophyticus]TCP56259.1 thiamine transport system ATP-binding protein [Tamaricihabitans halophyticus]
MLEIAGLTVRYGEFRAVSEVTLSVADGEVLALLGPSGCGKSTLLRAVAGLEAAQGAVRWDGAELSGVPVHRRGFGLVFQDGQLFPHRDVAGNIAFGLRMSGLARAERESRVAELLELVGLAGYGARGVRELSGGEQQRVALARALAPRPRLLLLDEPLSALDRMLRDQLAGELAELLRKTGSTALVVTHDHDEAATLADRVALLRAGRVVQTGAPEQVWCSPADEWAAGFLGCTAFLPARVRAGEASSVLGSFAVAGPDGPATLGLRPAGLRVAERGEVAGRVVGRTNRRDRVELSVRLDEKLGGHEVPAQSGVRTAPRLGEEVRLALDPDGVALVRP